MLNLLRNLFGQRHRSRFGRSRDAITRGYNNHPRGFQLGSLAAMAAPFVIRKLMSRRQQRAYGGAY